MLASVVAAGLPQSGIALHGDSARFHSQCIRESERVKELVLLVRLIAGPLDVSLVEEIRSSSLDEPLRGKPGHDSEEAGHMTTPTFKTNHRDALRVNSFK